MRRGAGAVPVLMLLFGVRLTAGEKERSPAERALTFFEAVGDTSVPGFLGRLRPAAVSAAARAQVLVNLPRDGELVPNAAERAKLATLEWVLDFHGRKGTVEIKVIDVRHAFVGLHARTVLLLSRDALTLVTPEELQALTAHELGHEYLWNEYQAAMAAGAHPRMQELELVCDGIAVITLRALGLDPARLFTAVTKMTRYNESLGATASARSYVSLGDRRRFIEAMSARTGWSSRRAPSAAGAGNAKAASALTLAAFNCFGARSRARVTCTQER